MTRRLPHADLAGPGRDHREPARAIEGRVDWIAVDRSPLKEPSRVCLAVRIVRRAVVDPFDGRPLPATLIVS